MYVFRRSSLIMLMLYSPIWQAIQALGRPFAMVPRFLWVFVVFVIYTVAGVTGREDLSTPLTNFLSILSYWLALLIVIVAEEHFLFRRKGVGWEDITWQIGTTLPSTCPVALATTSWCALM